GDRCRLHGHVGTRELLDVEAVGTGGAHAAPRAVVAEDDRPSHPGEAAYGLAQAAVEIVARSAIGFREHLDEQLECLDAHPGGTVRGAHDRTRLRPGPSSPAAAPDGAPERRASEGHTAGTSIAPR